MVHGSEPETTPAAMDLCRAYAYGRDMQEQMQAFRERCRELEQERDKWKAMYLTLKRQVCQ